MTIQSLRTASKIFLIAGAIFLLAFLVWVKATTGSVVQENVVAAESAYHHAVIESATVVEGKDFSDDPTVAVGTVEVQMTLRLDDGQVVSSRGLDETGLYKAGRRVIVQYQPGASAEFQWGVVDVERSGRLLWLTAVFALAVLALMGRQGVASLIGLAFSIAMIVWIIAPAMLSGQNPLLVATLGALAVMWVTLPMSHGFNWTTAAAMIGTAVALALTVLLTVVSVDGTFITGLANEDARNLRYLIDGFQLDLRGILMAGIVIGTLGVLDDVTVSQASTVAQLRAAAPNAPRAKIVAGALKVGRDHLAASVNTLFLAYAGASLPLLLLFAIGGVSLGEHLTSETVAQEIVRALAGSIGLVAAVPITTILAAMILDEDSAVLHDHDHGEVHPEQERLVEMYGDNSDKTT
ncbi:YibE/F family protein [Stomatohabitans albus]|uniref:YibE/F family protein n=1 Tax=Stomatohabitans albus TaxID=3110766 RepID=UPI00300C7044